MTQEKLKQLLHYNPDNGSITWKTTRNGRVKIGQEAGTLHPSGYIYIRINNNGHAAHRVAWLYIHGNIPEYIDHINHNRSDNKLANLRIATKQDNARNRTISTTNIHGCFGIYFESDRGKWTARITAEGKHKRIGRYKTKEEAIQARRDAEIKYGYHQNHGRTNDS